MKTIRRYALVLMLAMLPLPSATAEESDAQGALYAKFGVLVGFPVEDFPGFVDIDAAAGFALGAGYRFDQCASGGG